MRVKKWMACFMAALLLCGCGYQKDAEKETTLPTQIKESTAATTQPTVATQPLPPTTEAPTETTVPQPTGPEAYLAKMTLEEKIGQMFIVTPEQLTDTWCITEMDAALEEGIKKYHVGGLIYFSDNLQDREQTSGLIRDTTEVSTIPLFHCVDEEGGMVARVADNPAMGTTSFPDMMEVGASGDAADAAEVGLTIGKELKILGFNVDFAPVADVTTNPYNQVIGDRAFSTDPKIAADMIYAAVEGFRESGMICTLKHFPGHGDTETDSHHGFAATNRTKEELMECEMLPFISGIKAGAPMVMVGHVAAPNVTGNDLPATFSYELVTELLRDTLGFDGIIITDSLQMEAITDNYTSAEAVVLAVEAGVDVLLMPNNFPAAYEGLLEAVRSGRIPEERINESVLRILRCKEAYGIAEFD